MKKRYEDVGVIGEFPATRKDEKLLVRLIRDNQDGQWIIDMRTFYDHGKIPSQKGFRIKAGEVKEFSRLINNVLVVVEEIGAK